MRTYTDGHLANIGRSLDLPRDLLPDLLQELRLYLWLKPEAKNYQVRSAAIDFARREGPYSRVGHSRQTSDLVAAESREDDDFTAMSDRVMDYQAVWEALTASQRGAIVRAYWGAPYTSTAGAARLQARRLAA